MSLLLGIDIGTSSLKSVLYDPDRGGAVGDASREYPTHFPMPDAAEHDPDDWWKAACDSIRELLAETSARADSIAGVGVGGLGWSCLPVSRDGAPLRRAMIWMDRRAEDECRRLRERFGRERILQIAGNRIDPAYVTPKQLWLKKHEPETFRRAHCYVQSEAYLVFRLTKRFTQSLSSGYSFYFFDIAKGKWLPEIADEMGIPIEKHPPIFPCSDVVGEVTTEAAEATGLRARTPVVAGGLDAACAALGAGVVEPGQTQDQGGTAGGMSIYCDRPVSHPALILGYHVAPGAWLLQGGTVAGGASLKWFRNTFGTAPDAAPARSGADDFELLTAEAAQAEPGSGGVIFLPYLAGERSPIWDTDARGAFVGLSFRTKRPHLVRAVMEGCAFALQHNLETAKEAGVEFDVLFAVGGAARSDLWCQIKSDVTGCPVRVPAVSEGTALGAAILAGVGAGVFRDVRDGVKRMVRFERSFEPRSDAHKMYRRMFEAYRRLYPALKPTNDLLKGIASKGCG